MFKLRATQNARRYVFHEFAALCQNRRNTTRPNSTKAQKVDVEALLKTPSWSVRETLFSDELSDDTALISKEQLHHILRLSALPVPESSEVEGKMIGDLKAHLRFVQAIQKVNTDGVEPLQVIRDETQEARTLNTITMDALKEEFEKEEVVGSRGRIRKKPTRREPETDAKTEAWNPLSHASKTQGPHFVVDTAKD